MSAGRDDELVPLAGDLATRAELRRVMAREADEAEAAADAAERCPVTGRPVGDGDGQDVLRSAMAVIHAWDDDDNGTYVDLAKRFTAWAEQRARERAAEELDVATRWLMRTTDEHENGDWVTWDWRAKAADLLRTMAAEDRTGQR